MSQISIVSSHEEAESGESDHTTSSHSRCSSSSSVLTADVQAERSKCCSTTLGSGWTDSKHSSYLDFMEATFAKDMYRNRYCAEDVCGKSSCHHHQCVEIEGDQDDDSAESQLHIPFEPMEFKVCDGGDWTWRPASRSMAPAGIPLGLLTNPWVKHFQPKNASIRRRRVLSKTDEASRRTDYLSPKPVAQNVNYLQSVLSHELIFSSDSADAGVSKVKKRALWSSDREGPVTKQKMDSEVENGCVGTNDQDDASPPYVFL